jgi:RNA recognition motif-containing protein
MGQQESGQKADAATPESAPPEQELPAAAQGSPLASALRPQPPAGSEASTSAASPSKAKEGASPSAASAPRAEARAGAAASPPAAGAEEAAASISKPQEEKAAKTKGKSKGSGKAKSQGLRLCVKNLSEDMTQEQVVTLFEPFGSLLSVSVKTSESGKCRGFAFVTFADPEAATKAIMEMNDKDHGGKPLSVAIAADRTQAEGQSPSKNSSGGRQDKQSLSGQEGKGRGRGKGQEKGASKGKGKGKKLILADVAGPAPAQQLGFISPAQQGYAVNPYDANQYNYQQLFQQAREEQLKQMQAARYAQGLAQMQTMLQGLYLQAQAQSAQQVQLQQLHTAPAAPEGPVKAAVPPGPVQPQAKEYVGELKSVSTKNNYGFIACEELRNLTVTKENPKGRDVHIPIDLLPLGGQEVGSRLKFTIGYNTKGHPQARTCWLAP